MTEAAKALLSADARNRALRSFLQGLGYAVLAAVVMVLLPVFTNANGWGDFEWKLVGFSLTQAVGTAVLAFIMRRVLDPSGVPTPLPPTDSGSPTDPEAGSTNVWLIVIAGAVIALLLVVLFNVRANATHGDGSIYHYSPDNGYDGSFIVDLTGGGSVTISEGHAVSSVARIYVSSGTEVVCSYGGTWITTWDATGWHNVPNEHYICVNQVD